MRQKATSTGIEVQKQLAARLIINYYWVLVLVSLILFLYKARGKPELIELSFYPLYFLVGGLVKSFLQKRIASVFRELQQTGALPTQGLQSMVEDFQMRLNSRLGDILGIVGGLAIVWFYRNTLKRIVNPPLDYLSSLLVVAIDVLLAYAIGVATWKAIVTAFEFRRLGLRGQLNIRPFHPAGCSGLGAIGRLYFSLSLILISIGLFLCGWILYAHWINPTFNGAYRFFEPWFAGGLIILTIVSILSFFLPMITVHRLMKEQAANFEARLSALAEKISDFEESLLSEGSQLGHEQVEAQYEKIQFLRSIYAQRRKIQTWPIDLQTFTKFISVQIPLSIGIISSVLNLRERLDKLFG